MGMNSMKVLVVITFAAAMTGCSLISAGSGSGSSSASGSASNQTSGVGTTGTTTTTTTTGGTTTTTTSPSGSTSVSTTVPMFDNIPGRIQNALTLPATTATPSPVPLVSTLTGNFATAVTQQGPNLAVVSDPATATGGDAVPLMSFAACNDVKPASYGVTTTGTVAAQATNIVNAGLTIVNQCTAGLAATGTALNTSVTKLFTDLTTANSGTVPTDAATYTPALVAASPAATTTQAFIAVCTAATTFCTSMLSF
jgi:hypothetical protein